MGFREVRGSGFSGLGFRVQGLGVPAVPSPWTAI